MQLGEVYMYSILLYVIRFVTDLQQVSGILWLLQFLLPINIQYTYIFRKYIIYLYELKKQEEKRAFGKLFQPVSQRVQIYQIFNDNASIYPAISKSPKHLPNSLKIAVTSIVLIFSTGVICDISANLYSYHFFLSLYMNQVEML